MSDYEWLDELYLAHYGTKGMKWGRRRYQNKDGSLTPAGRLRYKVDDDGNLKKLSRKERKAAAATAAKEAAEAERQRTFETRRAKALTSTDAKELYDNRDTLTTNELNDRLNRLSSEKRLQQFMQESMPKEPPKQSVIDRAQKVIDKGLSVGATANKVYEFSKTPVGKALKKQLGFPEKETVFDPDTFMANINKKSDKQVQEFANRMSNQNRAKNAMDSLKGVNKGDKGKGVSEERVREILEEFMESER